jgi:hypothetical protein
MPKSKRRDNKRSKRDRLDAQETEARGLDEVRRNGGESPLPWWVKDFEGVLWWVKERDRRA